MGMMVRLLLAHSAAPSCVAKVAPRTCTDMAEFTGANERVPLGKKANAEAARRLKAGMMELIDDAEMGGGGGGRGPGAGDDDDDDEETRRWEAEMMRRGEQHYGSHARPAPSATDAASSQVYRAAPIPRAAPLPTLSGASGRVQSALMALEEAHTLDSKALEHFAHERAELDQQEKELREEVGKVAKKERWFAELRSFIEDVAGFLDAKVRSVWRPSAHSHAADPACSKRTGPVARED